MSRKKAIINIYNFIRMSNTEPSEFVQDDLDTIRNQLIHVKKHGFPGTYALKYDAVMEPRYQALMKEYLDENDDLSAWWEITEPLCKRAGIDFHDTREEEKYDDRLGSAYSLGYTPEERKRLVDAYMADFHDVFGKYPETIGSWVMDSVTFQYAADKYGVVGGALCRDQQGVDGFTLWGGYPTGMYYPSRKNEYVPAQTAENQMTIPVFRILGPDPIYNFEGSARREHGGIFTTEPVWPSGRDPKWFTWIFTRLTDEDSIGPNYAMVGQENNFLWANIQPGFEPQLQALEELSKTRDLRIETMGATARWYRKQYTRSAPMTYQASYDWDETMNLSTLWYASAGYRISFLGEKGHLRIRDFFQYDENYCSRYLTEKIQTKGSTFDALPIVSPQLWGLAPENRAFLRLLDDRGQEPEGRETYRSLSDSQSQAILSDGDGKQLAVFTMTPGTVALESDFRLHFDYLPRFRAEGDRIFLNHNDYTYSIRAAEGTVQPLDEHSLDILPVSGKILLEIMPAAEGSFRIPEDVPDPAALRAAGRPMPPEAPAAHPGASAFPAGTRQQVTLTAEPGGAIHYTLDGSRPTGESPLYESPISVEKPTLLKAVCVMPDGTCSETACYDYRFGYKDLTLTSPTVLDTRDAFYGNGITDLLQTGRGSVDYLDGLWTGTLDNLDVTAVLDTPHYVSAVTVGFLSQHRAGVVLPESIELYAGPDAEHMTLKKVLNLPNRRLEREIIRKDQTLELGETVGAVRVLAKRYARLPDWSQYRGDTHVFTLADCLILEP